MGVMHKIYPYNAFLIWIANAMVSFYIISLSAYASYIRGFLKFFFENDETL